MEAFLQRTTSSVLLEVQLKVEIAAVLRELVDDIERCAAENNIMILESNLQAAEEVNEKLVSYARHLSERNNALTEQLQGMRTAAVEARGMFVAEISPFLWNSKSTKKFKDRISQLEQRLKETESQLADALSMQPAAVPSTASNVDVSGTNDGIIESTAAAGAQSEGTVTVHNDAAAERIDEAPKPPPPETQISSDTANNPPDADKGIIAIVTNAQPVVEVAKEEDASEYQEFFLYDLEDEHLLLVFSFLTTAEVLHVAQVCRFMLKRIDEMFGIESSIIRPEWSKRPLPPWAIKAAASSVSNLQGTPTASLPAPPPINSTDTVAVAADTNTTAMLAAASSASAHGSSETVLTKEIINDLIKKLTPAELKVILSIADRSKKQAVQVETLTADKQDLNERLMNTESIRNFLIEKLKAAETEIKALMASSSALKKQAASDQEIIAFLDLKGHELEGEKVDLMNRCNYLQQSLDLQIGSHTHREQQLLTELHDYKLKYEELDSTFKSQKKMLIKEVKSLRAQVEVLTNERNVQASQFKMLKEALNITPVAPAHTIPGRNAGRTASLPAARPPAPSSHEKPSSSRTVTAEKAPKKTIARAGAYNPFDFDPVDS